MSLFKIDKKEISVEDLMKDIYLNSKNRKQKLDELFVTVADFVTDIGSAVNLMPEVTKLQQVSVNNDDALVKLLAIVTKVNKKDVSGDNAGFELSKEEKEQLHRLSQRSAEDNIPGNSK